MDNVPFLHFPNFRESSRFFRSFLPNKKIFLGSRKTDTKKSKIFRKNVLFENDVIYTFSIYWYFLKMYFLVLNKKFYFSFQIHFLFFPIIYVFYIYYFIIFPNVVNILNRFDWFFDDLKNKSQNSIIFIN